jgi:hypothetical protein
LYGERDATRACPINVSNENAAALPSLIRPAASASIGIPNATSAAVAVAEERKLRRLIIDKWFLVVQ